MRTHTAATIAAALAAVDVLRVEPSELTEWLFTLHPARLTNPMGLAGLMVRAGMIDDDTAEWQSPTRAIAPACREYTAWAKSPLLPGLGLAPLPLSRKADAMVSA